MSKRTSAVALVLLVVVSGTAVMLGRDSRHGAAAGPASAEAIRIGAGLRTLDICIPRGMPAAHDERAFLTYEKARCDTDEFEDELRLGDVIRLTLLETLRYSLTVVRQMKSHARHRVFLAAARGKGVNAVFLQKNGCTTVLVTDDNVGRRPDVV